MNTQDKARELLAQERQHDHQTHEKMVNRVVEEDQAQQQELSAKARELLTEDRQQHHNLDENMLSRTEAEIH